MRQQVKEGLAQPDLSSDDARDAAYQEVRSAFVEHYGKRVLRTPPASASLAPVVLAVAGLVVVVALVLFVVRRKARREVV